MDIARLMRSGLGRLVLTSWYDSAAVRLVTNWYLPLSRAWAAAIAADGSAERFAVEAGGAALPPWLVAQALKKTRQRHRAYEAANRRFDAVLFEAARPPRETLRRALSARTRAANEFMAARSLFTLPHMVARFPAVRFDVAGSSEVERFHGARRAHPQSAFAPPQGAFAPRRSNTVEGRSGSTFWVTFPAPAPTVADTAWARVFMPPGGGPTPSLIFTHGIAMETEFWKGLASAPTGLTARGIAMIRPEGPFHGRRRTPGRYGGEDLMARGLLGLLDYFHSHVIELGLLTAWARAELGGPVALGGVSLGALAAQRAA
ncbi:MAG: hypothetical protein WCF16_05320, partial [Alphaproteobacteria bacterium]